MTTANPESILDSVKKALGLDPDNTVFDLDVIMFINSTFGSLQQLGVGPSSGFSISDNNTLWTDYVFRPDIIGMVRTYMTMSVRMAFDPPATSFGIDAVRKQVEELGWRINIAAETTVSSGWWLLDGLTDFPAEASIGDFGFDSTSGNIYVNGAQSTVASWWDLTNLSDFPVTALVGEFGYSSTTGQVWRKIA